MTKKKILIVEDDVDLNQTLKDYLELCDFGVVSVFDGEIAVEKAFEERFDLILLDIRLPSIDGFEVASQIRKFSDIPIIFITALEGETHAIEAFLKGGDDYIRKPFSLEELKCRINAIIRRTFGNKNIITINKKLYFDVENMRLINNGNPVHLKNKELLLLKIFLKNKGKVVTKEQIYQEIYAFDDEPNENSLRTFVRNIRTIIGRDKIETVKNIGYRYVG